MAIYIDDLPCAPIEREDYLHANAARAHEPKFYTNPTVEGCDVGVLCFETYDAVAIPHTPREFARIAANNPIWYHLTPEQFKLWAPIAVQRWWNEQ